MKIPKFIASGLASGALRLRPEVLDVVKNLSCAPKRETDDVPVEEPAPEPPPEHQEPPAPPPPPCRNQRRLVFVSPLPGRWIRWSCVMFSWAALGLTQPAHAAGQPAVFNAANQAFAAGNPAEAARGYESVIARQGCSAPVLFNLANAQLREGKPGQAILNYERARWLAPRDPDIEANLRLALEQLRLPVPALAWPVRYADWLSLNDWGRLAEASLALFAATLPLALALPRQQPALRLARLAAAVMLLGSLTALGARWGDLDRAIVTGKEAAARISPVTMGQALFTLPEGAVVKIVKPHGHFALVRTADGHQGWVSRDVITPILATAP